MLICVGLAVDYAAHIAHMFKDSNGKIEQRDGRNLESQCKSKEGSMNI